MKHKKIKLGTIAILGLLLALPVGAQTGTPIKDARAEIKNERGVMKNSMETDRQNFKNAAETERQATKGQIGQNRDALKAKITDLKNNGTKGDIKMAIEAMKTENKELRLKTDAEIKVERDALKAKFKQDFTDFKGGKKEKLDAARKEKVTSILNQSFEKLTNVISSLEKFDAKVAELISKRKDKGLDVTNSESLLAGARMKLDEAKASVLALQSTSSESVSAKDGVNKEALKASIAQARALIVTTRDAYKTVLNTLPRAGVKGEVSTEASATTSN